MKNSVVNFKNNTVLFIWSRLKDLADMGYGYRFMTKTDSYLDRNVIGLTTFAGIDRTRTDSPASKEAERKTTCTNSVFFLNRQAALTIPGGGLYQRIKVEGFEDVEQLAEVEGNVALKDPSVFKGRLNAQYLNAFLSMKYSESTKLDEGKCNGLRSVLGLPLQGTIKTQCDMFCNRYPLEDALKLFALPRTVGSYGGFEIIATKGRFGPYLKWNAQNFSLPRGKDPLKVSLEDCINLIAAQKDKPAAGAPIAQFGDIQVINGRYGAYLKHGADNYRLPKGTRADELTEEDCRRIISESSPTSSTGRKFRKRYSRK